MQLAWKMAGRESTNGWLGMVLYVLLAPALWAYMQVSLNEIWEQAEAGHAPPPAGGDMPPRLADQP